MGVFQFTIFTMALNGLMLTLALGLFLLVFWLNPRRSLNLYFMVLLITTIFWTIGATLSYGVAVIGGGNEPLIRLGVSLMQGGFLSASVGLYMFVVVLVGARGRVFATASIAGGVVLIGYQLILLLVGGVQNYSIEGQRLIFNFTPLSFLLFGLFDSLALLLLWGLRRRIAERGLFFGAVLFGASQFTSLLSPYLRSMGVPVSLANSAVLFISFSLVRQQVVAPLLGRQTQLQAVRDIGLKITSRLNVDAVLSAVATQAAALLAADGAAIYLLKGDVLELAAVQRMPSAFVGYTLALGSGVVGNVALTGQPMRLDDYTADWKGEPDFPFARETVGSAVVIPLVFSERIQGVLIVAQGKQSRIFTQEDVRRLELLGPQAAVAIANSALFERQRDLADALSASKNQLETVLTSTQNPVVAVDRALQVIFSNPAAIALFEKLLDGEGKPLSWQDHTPITALVPRALLPQDTRQVLRTLRESQVFIYEIDAAERVFLCHLAPLGGGPRAVGWVAVLNDITELKELDRFKSQMVRMTSHDLKNPLFAAMSYADLLADELESEEKPQLLPFIETINQQLERMNRTISSILDLERLQAGGALFECCDPAALTEDALEEIQARAAAKQITLQAQVDAELPYVLGDSLQLTHALVNVIENAVKFTPEGGEVLVTARAEADGISIAVQDNGVGIPAEYHTRVFERFFRVQQPGVEHISGSGLGLNLVKTIVNAHAGRVWLESEPGQGTTVFIWLPYGDGDTGA